MRSPLTERKYAAGFGVKTYHSDKNLKRILILLIFTDIYDFFSKLQFFHIMHFYHILTFFKLFFGFALELWCVNFGTKMCSLHCGIFSVFFFFFFSTFQFSVIYNIITENGNFQFFLISFPQRFSVSSHT